MILNQIIVNLEVEGLHKWPEASKIAGEDVGFLDHIHRHLFKIKLVKRVTHSDRDVEIILFKREVAAYLHETYGFPVCHFGRMSCEEIATELLTQFSCDEVEVMEDGENGASAIQLQEDVLTVSTHDIQVGSKGTNQ